MDTARVIYHYEDGTWWAESPDVERWSAAGESFPEVRKLAEEGIPFATERDDWQLRHIVPAELLPYFTGKTAGGVARVTILPTHGFRAAAQALPAGVAQEMSVA